MLKPRISQIGSAPERAGLEATSRDEMHLVSASDQAEGGVKDLPAVLFHESQGEFKWTTSQGMNSRKYSASRANTAYSTSGCRAIHCSGARSVARWMPGLQRRSNVRSSTQARGDRMVRELTRLLYGLTDADAGWWKIFDEIARQCNDGECKTINVASKRRSAAIVWLWRILSELRDTAQEFRRRT